MGHHVEVEGRKSLREDDGWVKLKFCNYLSIEEQLYSVLELVSFCLVEPITLGYFPFQTQDGWDHGDSVGIPVGPSDVSAPRGQQNNDNLSTDRAGRGEAEADNRRSSSVPKKYRLYDKVDIVDGVSGEATDAEVRQSVKGLADEAVRLR